MGESQEKLIKFVMGRQSTLETDKEHFNQGLQDVADLVAPHREDIRGTNQRGEEQGKKIYDGTAVGAAILATSGIHGYHVSPAFAWFKYVMNRKDANKIIEVKKWLEEVEFNMYMALSRSNFYGEMWPFIYDGFTLGTAAIYPEEDLAEERIVFEAMHPGEIYIAENKYGEVDVLHRKKKMTARQLAQRFGRENLSDSAKQAVENAPFSEFVVIHAVFPREEYDDRMKDAKNKKYASVWIQVDGDTLLDESGYDQFPFHVWRYLKTGKYAYGTSPSHLAMADIKGINLMNRTLQGAAQLSIDPAYNVPSSFKGKLRLSPRGINRTSNGQDKITPINDGGNFPFGIDREQAKQQAIRERFHVDTFLLLTQLAAGGGDRTKFEVQELMAEKAAILGAEFETFNTEVDSILGHTYKIETDAGRIPGPPDIILEMAAEDEALRFDPVYQGPLAQSQKERFEKEPIKKFMVDVAPILSIKEEAADNIDFDAGVRLLGEDVPAELLKSLATVTKVREGRAIAEREMQQQEALTAGLENLKTGSEADKNTDGRISQAIGGAGAGL